MEGKETRIASIVTFTRLTQIGHAFQFFKSFYWGKIYMQWNAEIFSVQFNDFWPRCRPMYPKPQSRPHFHYSIKFPVTFLGQFPPPPGFLSLQINFACVSTSNKGTNYTIRTLKKLILTRHNYFEMHPCY